MKARPTVVFLQEATSPVEMEWSSSDGDFMVHASMRSKIKGCALAIRKGDSEGRLGAQARGNRPGGVEHRRVRHHRAG